MAKQLPATKILNYSLHSSSGHSASYLPENIKINQPADQASRWSSAANDQNQFLTLKLDKMCLLESIGFGKFHKVHVCNLKEFKIYAGPTLDSLQLILHSGLNNDTIPETFPPDFSLSGLPDNQPFPVQFIKIVPMAAWGSNFNFSIWYVELRGWEEGDHGGLCTQLVKAAHEEYLKVRESETTRLVLKFLRQKNHQEAFAALQKTSGYQLEAPVVSQFYALLSQTRLEEAEKLLVALYTENPNIFNEFIHNSVPYQVTWTRLDDCLTGEGNFQDVLDENGDYRMMNCGRDPQQLQKSTQKPSARGGHQMLWDPIEGRVLLLGGWDGKKDLADFWSFDPKNCTWTLLSMNVEREGGPCGRSCHKAVLHPTTREIYLLGRYIDPERRDPHNIPCDFYRYSLTDAKWTRLSADVRAEGGPGCIYDHQMIIDEEDECLWVFGGRLLSGSGSEHSVYSGLYKFNLKSNTWTLIQPDISSESPCDPAAVTEPLPAIKIPSRIGHSMLFDPLTRSLLILSGQRYKDQLSDFYKYSVDRTAVTQFWKHLQLTGGPEAGFTQRAVLDSDNREMFVFSSSLRNGADLIPSDCHFWCFDLKSDKWTRIDTPNRDDMQKPPARFAHQIVYDPVTKTHFLFGGNPGNPSDPSARLDDLWAAQLRKSQQPDDLLRHCQYLLRREIFDKMAVAGDIPAALRYLQTDLSAVVNHADPAQSASFRALSAKLFLGNVKETATADSSAIFDEIVQFLPKYMQPPRQTL